MKPTNKACFWTLTVIFLSACSGGGSSAGSGSSSSTVSALTLVSSTPSNNAMGVLRNNSLVLSFSADLDPSTAIPSNVSLTDGGTSGGFILLASGKQLTITPAKRLHRAATYTLTIDTGLSGMSGEKLANPQTIKFSTDAERSWDVPQIVAAGNTAYGAGPQIAADSNGNALAVWQQINGGTVGSTYASRYTPAGGWETARAIENGGGATGNSGPRIAMDQDGNAIAVWAQDDGTAVSVYANRYTPSGGWGSAQLIENSNENAGAITDAAGPQIAMDRNGNAIAVWKQYDGAVFSVYANRYTPAGGWETPQLIENSSGLVNFPYVAFNRNGDAVAVWNQYDGVSTRAYASRYTQAGGWEAPQLIQSSVYQTSPAQIAFDASGNAIVLLDQWDGSHLNLYANRYTSSGGWGTPQLIQTGNTDLEALPKLGIDGNGNAIALWVQDDGVRTSVYANRYTPSGGWGTARLLENDDTGDADTPALAIDSQGNAVAVWTQLEGAGSRVHASRYTPSGGWEADQRIENIGLGAFDPAIAIDGNDDAIAIWRKFVDTTNDIYTARFD